MHIAMSTRPDIARSGHSRALYQSLDAGADWLVACKCCATCGTASHGITMGARVGCRSTATATLVAAQTRRSTTGACVVLHGGVVDYSTQGSADRRSVQLRG
jgi:hypothetical protein